MKGNPGGPGRPRKSERLKGYAAAVGDAVPPEVLGRIVRRLAKKALSGTDREALRAAELVIRCTLGSDPAAALEMLDRLGEIEDLLQERQQEQQQEQQRQQREQPRLGRGLNGQPG
jgi:hypothetical protein